MLLKIITKIGGTVFLLYGAFFFFAATVNLTADVRLAGPMNMWPPPLWVYFIFDVVFALLALLGMKLLRLTRLYAGLVMSITSVLVLIFVIKNQLNAPSRDGLLDGGYMAADIECYVAAYIIAASILLAGVWLIIQHAWRRKHV